MRMFFETKKNKKIENRIVNELESLKKKKKNKKI
jgi:hypothetical protein